MRRATRETALMAIALFVLPALAFAGDAVLVDLANPKAALLPGTATVMQGSFSLPVPGTEAEVNLSEIREKTTESTIPVFDASGKFVRKVHTTLMQVTDYNDLYGVVAKTDGGEVYGTVLNGSAEKPYFYQISPAKRERAAAPGAAAAPHLVEKLFAADLEAASQPRRNDATIAEDSGALAPRALEKGVLAAAASASAWRSVQMMIVAPSEFTGTRSDDEVAAQVVQTVRRANVYFEPLQVRVEIAGIQILRNGVNDPYAAAAADEDAAKMLTTVQRQWVSVQLPEHDVVAVLGKGYFKGFWGLAYRSASCTRPEYSYLFASQGGDSAQHEITFADTLAHELGHVVGMDHDDVIYPNGPSLMWSGYVLNPFGFSAKSTSEFQGHAGSGLPGGACFGGIDTPPDTSSRQGGAVQFRGPARDKYTLAEGAPFTLPFALSGDVSTVMLRAEGLPAGATFDPLTATLRYTPGFDVADKRHKKVSFPVTIIAENSAKQIRKTVTLVVRDVNRAPVIGVTNMRMLDVLRPGSIVELNITAADPDRYDKVQIKFLSKKLFRSLPGTKRVTLKGRSARIAWAVPAGFRASTFTLRFRAEDSASKSRVLQVPLAVVP